MNPCEPTTAIRAVFMLIQSSFKAVHVKDMAAYCFPAYVCSLKFNETYHAVILIVYNFRIFIFLFTKCK